MERLAGFYLFGWLLFIYPQRKSKASVSCVLQPKEPFIDFARFSTYSRLLRTVAWIIRFVSSKSERRGKN